MLVPKITTDEPHMGQGDDYPTILCALAPNCLQIRAMSPVDIEVVAPDGRNMSRQMTAIPGASFMEIEDEDTHVTTTVLVPFPLPGNYKINVSPKDGASPTDTYTLEVTREGTTIVLAQNQPVHSIPPQGYTVVVSPPNQPPLANAGSDRTVNVGSLVTLDGSASSDPDNGPAPLSFTWTQTAGPTVTLTGVNTATPTFTPTVVGDYTFSLVVNDGEADSSLDIVRITVLAAAKKLASLSPAKLWIGLKNSDDQGTNFDLRVELLKNGAVIASGETKDIQGVARNPDKAKEVAVPFGTISGGTLASRDALSLRVLAKTTDQGGHNNATGLRLYYDTANRPSGFGAEITPDPLRTFFLHSGTSNVLAPTPPTAQTAQFKDSPGFDNKTGRTVFKEIGTWSLTVR
jgi:hypothetical protein